MESSIPGLMMTPSPRMELSETPMHHEKHRRLQELFRDMGSVLVAFSGGVDSSLVLRIAHQTLGEQAIGVTAVSPTFPELELEAASRIVTQIGVRHVIFHTDQLLHEAFVRNDAARCYHCKTDLYRALSRMQRDMGVDALVDGTNLEDLEDDRPGLSAAKDWGVRSPLVEAGLGKQEVRDLAKQLGLSNWDKPAAACLSSRIPRGIPITRDKLSRVEQAEAVLAQEGLRQFRVRDHEGLARIEVDRSELPSLFDQSRLDRLTVALKSIGFRFVTLDLEGYRRGSSNG